MGESPLDEGVSHAEEEPEGVTESPYTWVDARNSLLHADNSFVSLVVGALQEAGHVAVVIDHHRQTRRSARRGLLLQRFGDPTSIVVHV